MGRPALLATTRHFLDDLGLQSLDQLPVLGESGVQERMLQSLQLPEEEAFAQPELPTLAVAYDQEMGAEQVNEPVVPGDTSAQIPNLEDAAGSILEQ